MDRSGFLRGGLLTFGVAVFLFASCALLRAGDLHVAQAQPGARFANTAEGLKLFLTDGVAAAKSGDKSKLDAFMKDTSILHAYDWFIATYGQKDGVARVDDYVSNIGENEKDIRESFARIGRDGGEIATRSVNDHPEPDNRIELEMLRGLKRPTSFYCAEWRQAETPNTENGKFIGYFVFAAGKFRIARVYQRVIQLHLVPHAKNGTADLALTLPARPSISGTKYTNPAGHFTLDLPAGWKINEEIAKAPMAIGALSDPDGGANAVIQLMPTDESPSEFLQALDAKGATMFENYKKVAVAAMTLDGEEAASLTLTQTDRQAKLLGVAIPRTLEWFVVVIRVKEKDIFINFTTTEAHFGAKESVFRGIVDSFRLDEK